MSELVQVFRARATVIWCVLIAATVVSWYFGTNQLTTSHAVAAVVVITVAFAKIYLIGMNFMELRTAPVLYRNLFRGYCTLVYAALVATFLVTIQ